MSQAYPLDVIRLGRATCGELIEAERREWWLTNGRGAYAAGTIAQSLTRRYHGLLVAPVIQPLGRHLVFAKADATLLTEAHAVPLHTNRWASGVIDPQGHVHIEAFEIQGRMPVWRYAFGRLRIEQRIWLEPGANTVYLAYRAVENPDAIAAQLALKLLINARDHHGNTGLDLMPELALCTTRTELAVQHAGTTSPPFTLRFLTRGGAIETDRTWYHDFDLSVERERGLPAVDNHLCVGEVTLDLNFGDWVGIAATVEDEANCYLNEALRRFKAYDDGFLRRAQVVVPELRSAPDWVQQLVRATDDFIFARPLPDFPHGQSVIAGYPWFGDWGRDTMIALPGLLLATGRFDTARVILETFARFIDRGMLPNVFPGAGTEPEYNSVDAALWYIEAWRAYCVASDDYSSLAKIFPVLAEVIAHHHAGTRFGIGVDPVDGLLRAGEEGVQLTWMDAKLGDWVVTPRRGKPVEINALWFNALMTMADFAARLNLAAEGYRAAAAQVAAAFKRFVRSDGLGLYDVIDGPQGNDSAIRPNQIFAVSLTHSPLTHAQQAAIVRCCGDKLLCSYGLRSLDVAHPDYRGRYVGGVPERDAMYHQGPVWAWLLGHHALAVFRATGDRVAAQSLLDPIQDHLRDAGLGTVSEIFDGDPPHHPRGAPAQAWSVACILEAWCQLERAKLAAETELPNVVNA
jgi:predicted glycogen debranching enzyme